MSSHDHLLAPQLVRYFNSNIRADLLAWLTEEASEEERQHLRGLVSCATFDFELHIHSIAWTSLASRQGSVALDSCFSP